MTEEQQKDIEQLFDAMGKSGGRFVIGQVVGSQTNYFGDGFAPKSEETSRQEADSADDQARDSRPTLSATRQDILDHLLTLADKGDWKKDDTANRVKQMLLTVLGQGDVQLRGKAAEQSEALWRLLENGRGDRLRIVWQNMVGYLDDRKLLRQKGSPALNRDFFGDEEGYTNIDKGRPSRNNMSSGFREMLPLLDAYVPKE